MKTEQDARNAKKNKEKTSYVVEPRLKIAKCIGGMIKNNIIYI